MTRQSVRVLAYSGHRGEEEPRSFETEGRRVEVAEILRRWREPDGRGFEVLDREGSRHVLFCEEPDLTWWKLGSPDS